jgi:hypothetical protein
MSYGSSGLWDTGLKTFLDNLDLIVEARYTIHIKCSEKLDKNSLRTLELVILYEKNDNTK